MVLDEVDKLARPETTHGRDIGGEGVQQALLKLMEGTTLMVPKSRNPRSHLLTLCLADLR